MNPGPRHVDIFPCGYCQKPVTWGTPGVCCGNCEVWFHCPCVDISSQEYDRLRNESQSWDCYRCNTLNDSIIYHAYNVDVRNSFSALSMLDEDSVFLLTGPTSDPNLQHTSSSQVLHSSPKHSYSRAGHAEFGFSRSLPSSFRSSKATDATCSVSITHNSSSACNSSAIPSKKQNLRNITLNCNSIPNKGILDLFCTNKPGLVKACYSIPGLSDHEGVLTDCDIKAQVSKKPPRKIFMWTKANWDLIRSEVGKFKEKFLSEYTSRSVEDNYNEVSKCLEFVIDQHVPSKISTSKSNTPWFNPTLKRMCRKKQRLFSCAKKSHKKAHWDKYKSHKRDTLKAIRRCYWDYIHEVLNLSLNDNNSKPFWKYIRSQRQENLVVSALKENGQLYSGNIKKAEILSKQFCSVFTKDSSDDRTRLFGPNYPPIDSLCIEERGVQQLLAGLNVSKASGPDQISCRVLKELASELASILTCIFRQSIGTATLPSVWTKHSLPQSLRRVTAACLATIDRFPLPAYHAKFWSI